MKSTHFSYIFFHLLYIYCHSALCRCQNSLASLLLFCRPYHGFLQILKRTYSYILYNTIEGTAIPWYSDLDSHIYIYIFYKIIYSKLRRIFGIFYFPVALQIALYPRRSRPIGKQSTSDIHATARVQITIRIGDINKEMYRFDFILGEGGGVLCKQTSIEIVDRGFFYSYQFSDNNTLVVHNMDIILWLIFFIIPIGTPMSIRKI